MLVVCPVCLFVLNTYMYAEVSVMSLMYIQWFYGVTCWEVFSGGKGPYPGVDPVSLAGMLENGYRMEKPNNAACSDDT